MLSNAHGTLLPGTGDRATALSHGPAGDDANSCATGCNYSQLEPTAATRSSSSPASSPSAGCTDQTGIRKPPGPATEHQQLTRHFKIVVAQRRR